MIDHEAVKLALRNQALPALPALRAWENDRFVPSGTEYVEEEYVPAGATLLGLTSGGVVEDTALYLLRWFGRENIGTTGINASLTTLLARFRPGSSVTATDGTTVRIRGDIAPWRSGFQRRPGGYLLSTVTIPVRTLTLNS